jgi:hypothetical protein
MLNDFSKEIVCTLQSLMKHRTLSPRSLAFSQIRPQTQSLALSRETGAVLSRGRLGGTFKVFFQKLVFVCKNHFTYFGKEYVRVRGGRAGEREKEEHAKNTVATVPRSHHGGWRASAS